MTIGTEPPIIRYAYTSPATFSFNFRITEEESLQVRHVAKFSDAPVLLELTTDYTVNLVEGFDGGTVTLRASLVLAEGLLELRRNEDIDQETDYVNNDPFDMDILERSLDKLTMIDQQQQEELARCIKAETGGATAPFLDLRDAEGKVLEVTADGKRIVGVTSAADIRAAAANSAISAAAALASQNAAALSQDASNKWATEAENLQVDDGVNPVNFSAYHYMKKSEALVATGVSIRNGFVDGVGDMLTDFNAMDWTGHRHAVGTTFEILSNTVAQFQHNENLYDWFGPKAVTVGLGGNYVATAEDFFLVAASAALSISFNPNTSTLVATNVQAAIDEVDAKIEAQAVPNGYNVLINGDLRIDQRKVWLGNWSNVAVGQFGPDRWVNMDDSVIRQVIENNNMVDQKDYTLSWDGGGTAIFNGVDGVEHTGIVSGDTVNVGLGGIDAAVRVPITSTNIKLELGSVATPFEPRNTQQEIAMCQRYYWESGAVGVQLHLPNSNSTFRSANIMLPVTMRGVPTIIDIVSSGLSIPADITINGYRAQVDVGNTTSTVAVTNIIANAEIM